MIDNMTTVNCDTTHYYEKGKAMTFSSTNSYDAPKNTRNLKQMELRMVMKS